MALDTVTLRAGIYARLTAAMPAGTRIYSHVPAGAAYPYLRIGDVTVDDASAKDLELHDVEFEVHAFSRSKESPLEVENLMKLVNAALHNQEGSITLTSGRLILLRCEFQTSFQQTTPNDTYWHGIQRYRALTQDI